MSLNLALFTQSALSVAGTELSLTNGTSSIAVNTNNVVISIWLEVVNMAAGDEFELALYEKVLSGGTARRIILADLIGVQPDPIFVVPSFHVGIGWDVTLKRIAGSTETFNCSIRSIS